MAVMGEADGPSPGSWVLGPGRPHVAANASSKTVIKRHGKAREGHLAVVHTTLKCCEGFEFSHVPRLPDKFCS